MVTGVHAATSNHMRKRQINFLRGSALFESGCSRTILLTYVCIQLLIQHLANVHHIS